MRPLRLPATLPLLVLLLLPAGCGADDDAAPSPAAQLPSGSETLAPPPPSGVASGVPSFDVDRVVTLSYAGGRVTGDTGRIPIRRGSKVRIVVTSDVAEELHLHVYDRRADVSPGSPAEIVFTADVPGQVELELEGSHTPLVRLVIA